VRTVAYELGQTVPTKDGPQRTEYMDGDDLVYAFDNYMHAQELGRWIREHGGRY
jgi:hypothetical protein